MLQLYKSPVRPKLEYCIQAWRPYLKDKHLTTSAKESNKDDHWLFLKTEVEKLSTEVHNSRWPLDRLTLTSDLIFIGGRGIMMDYLYAKFGIFSFSHFWTDRQTESQRRMIAILKRLPSALVIIKII